MSGPAAPPAALPRVIVLASGRGERFMASGGSCHKLDALLAGRTVFDRTLSAVRDSGLQWHVERAVHPGMGDAIAAAVRATPDAPGWLLLPADLPLVGARAIRQVADVLAQAGADVVRPLFVGRHGHPVGFSRGMGAALAALSGDAGASALVAATRQARRLVELDLDDPGAVTDIDTVDDLARAEEMLARLRSDGAGHAR